MRPTLSEASLSQPQVCQAMCTLLAMVLPRVPNSVLRSKFVGCSALLCRVLELHRQQVRLGVVAAPCVHGVWSQQWESFWWGAAGAHWGGQEDGHAVPCAASTHRALGMLKPVSHDVTQIQSSTKSNM